MIGDILQPTHLLFVLVIALLVLGPKRLPEVGRALGRGLRDFKHAINGDELRDQMISPTGTASQQPAEQAPPAEAPPEPPDAPVAGEPIHAPTTADTASSVPSTGGSGPSPSETIPAPEATATTATPERVP